MNRERAAFALACAAALALIAAAYSNSFQNSFHFDDSHVIVSNIYIRSLDHISRYFTDARTFSSVPQNATYRPLVTLTLALDYARAGSLDPRPFHVTQIVLMLVTGALLVVFFTPMIGRWPSLLAATLFCIHTANTETINLISARSELLSTIGLLGSFVLFQRSPFARRTLLYLVPLAIGALAKAPLVVFAPLLFLYAMLFEGQPPRRALRTALPALILGVALLVFLNRMNAPEWTSGGGPAWPYLITQPFIWLHYFRLFFLPIGLTADTDLGSFAHWYDTRAVAGYAFVVLLVWFAWRAKPAVKFGIAWFVIALLPTSIFPLAEIANEHRIFFAYIGLVLAFAALLPPRLFEVAAVVVLLMHAFGTHQRNEVWRNEETLWADVVTKSPGNGRAWMNYGLTRMAKGEYAAAKSDFEHAATLTPNYSTLEINRGIIEGELGNPAEAERHFRRALELNADPHSHFFFARWLVRQGRAPEAIAHIREAVRQSPAYVDAHDLAARLGIALGIRNGQRWLDYKSAFQAGLVANGKRDWLASAEANRDALRHDPRSADAHLNLGWALAQLGFRDQAAREYLQTLALRPNDERAGNNLRLLK